ncbi:hypothetical protein SAMN02927914_06199 [Mesorhizobium qingshengii]|uniref:Uncharacterized protein n=1 Tax=Mesorhizobium qingshengii TaxID=1165689 RepID=A0A1G5ZV91_9HYPH|nr:hypothetical protein SAMN02927914_06199 [Mesorhizobium qingshengii]
MAPDAADGQEPRPPSLDRQGNAAGSPDACRHLRGHVACVVNTSNSIMAREPPCVFWMAAQRFRDRSRLAANFTPLGSNASKPRWMTAQARMFGTLAPASDARRVKMIVLHNAPRLCTWAGSKGAGLGVHISGVGGRIKPIGSDPPGCRRVGAHIILAAPDARPASGGPRLAGECPNRHGAASHTSPPRCTWSPRCPWPDRK